MDKKRATRRF